MIYSCKPLFEKIKAQVGAEIDSFPIEDPPTVCIITTGDDEPSARYVRNKLKDFAELGIVAEVKRFDTLFGIMSFLIDNKVKSDYDGIIVQRPILVSDATPKDASGMVAKYMPMILDIDGVVTGSEYLPPSVRGLDLLLHEWDYDPAGKTAVVIGRGDVGKPVAEYLLRRDATVTVCHSKTPAGALWYEMNISDIVVGAAGLESPIKAETGHANAIIIDYGITKDQKTGELHGDVKEAPLFKYQTPVPGGMGLMVRAALLLNVLDAYKWHRGIM